MTEQIPTGQIPTGQIPTGQAPTGQATPDPAFDTLTARLIHREALRRAAADLNTASPSGLENALARISKEVTEEAEARRAATPPEGSHPSKP